MSILGQNVITKSVFFLTWVLPIHPGIPINCVGYFYTAAKDTWNTAGPEIFIKFSSLNNEAHIHLTNANGVVGNPTSMKYPYQIIVADAADAVSVNFSGRCKFLQI